LANSSNTVPLRMAPDEKSDNELMEELQAGQDGALSALIERWQQPLAAFVYRYMQNATDTSEITQETFVRVYQSRLRYRPGSRFSTWLFTIAANLCRNRARWRKRHPTVPLDFGGGGQDQALAPLEMTPDERAQAPNEPIEERERAEAVREAIGDLPHDLKTALILFQYEHLSHQEIGAVVGCSSKAVETRIYRARQLLKKKLAWLLRDEAAKPGLKSETSPRTDEVP
jgi:RNA polymerase sigma-70 factor, ECF subfamily